MSQPGARVTAWLAKELGPSPPRRSHMASSTGRLAVRCRDPPPPLQLRSNQRAPPALIRSVGAGMEAAPCGSGSARARGSGGMMGRRREMPRPGIRAGRGAKHPHECARPKHAAPARAPRPPRRGAAPLCRRYGSICGSLQQQTVRVGAGTPGNRLGGALLYQLVSTSSSQYYDLILSICAQSFVRRVKHVFVRRVKHGGALCLCDG